MGRARGGGGLAYLRLLGVLFLILKLLLKEKMMIIMYISCISIIGTISMISIIFSILRSLCY